MRSSFKEKLFVAVVGLILGVLLFCLVAAWPFMLLWNWLMPIIFGLCTLTFWQACGLLLLASFLFRTAPSNVNSK